MMIVPHFIIVSLSPQTIESNWRCGRHSLQRIHCRSETSKGVYCLQYDDQKIVSGLRDNTIKVRAPQQARWGRKSSNGKHVAVI